MLSYSVGEEQTDLSVVSFEGGLRVETLAIDEKDLQRQVNEVRELIRRALPGDETGAVQSLSVIGKRLYRTLIQPVAAEVGKSDRVLIIPDGPLHLLPWGALIRDTGENVGPGARSWQYLAEWKPLHTALSATAYAELKRDRNHEASGSRPPIQLAAFGDPSYPGSLNSGSRDGIGDVRAGSAVDRGVFDWSPLPYSRREVEQISALYPREVTRTYLGAEATEEAAKSIAEGARIVHFATHGHFDDRFPLNSALVLTIPEELSDGRDNGYLQVREIFERVRLDADLVVLSACASALGKEQGREGLIGLTRAFQYAGARSVVASLWNVRDQATAELMVRFYRHLNAGESKDEALRAAQVELIRGPVRVRDEKGRMVERDFSAPYYWAVFQVYGDWQ